MIQILLPLSCFFFFNDTATTEIYTLSLHDALPICAVVKALGVSVAAAPGVAHSTEELQIQIQQARERGRSEEHTSELQSQSNLVCRLLLEKKKKEKHVIHLQIQIQTTSQPNQRSRL